MRVVAIAGVMAVTQVGEPVGCSGSEPGHVTWTHSQDDGRFAVELVGCQDWDTSTFADRIEVDAGWTRCAVVASVKDGGLRVESEPVWIDGDDQQINFGLPQGPVAGMGAEVVASHHSVRILDVISGYPAELAGLKAGDRVLSVDGWSTRHVTTRAFVRMVTGEPGSVVELEVLAKGEDEPHRVRLERARIP